MSSYADKWSMRPGQVDCYWCGGDGNLRDDEDADISPEKCCSFTGLDQIPWSELFKKGRKHRTKR